jgi:hypothetical protein
MVLCSEDGYFNLDDINGDGVDDLTTPLLKTSYRLLHLTQSFGYQWVLFTLNTVLIEKQPWVAICFNQNSVWNFTVSTANYL